MNYLAHLYLSQADDELALGNFIADFVKGNHYRNFSPQVSKGILMHRSIDSLTDNHPSYLTVKKIFRESHGRYSGIVSDIVFDYILAKNWSALNESSLYEFQKKINKILIYNFPVIPLKGKIIVPFFIRNRWLTLYEKPETLHRVLTGMSKYRGIQGNTNLALEIVNKEEKMIGSSFFQTINGVVFSLKTSYPEISEIETKLKRD
jgi:acyl carrier protein phosphodiesterase